jgi:ABC-2 type transport system permease protein
MTASAPSISWASLSRPRSGLAYWLRSFGAILRWETASLRLHLPIIIAIQAMAGAGFVLMISLLVPGDPPPGAVRYLVAGIPVLNLYILGLMFGPQWVAEQRVAETYDAMQALPIPRTAAAAAWYVVTLLAGVPGMLATLLVAEWRYNVAFAISPAVVPAVLLVVFAGTMLGYAIGHGVREPMVARIGVQALNMFIVGFTPTMFAPDRLPDWLQAVNRVLPFEHMSALLRASLTSDPVDNLAGSYAIVIAWSCACALLAARAITRRG